MSHSSRRLNRRKLLQRAAQTGAALAVPYFIPGSALGKSVVRLGKLFGFKTLCVVRSDSNSDVLRELGADAIVETDQQDLIQSVSEITSGQGVGYAIDCVGGELTANVVRCLGLGGRLLVYGTLANSPLTVPLRDLMMPSAEISGFLLPNWLAKQSPLRLLGSKAMRSTASPRVPKALSLPAVSKPRATPRCCTLGAR